MTSDIRTGTFIAIESCNQALLDQQVELLAENIKRDGHEVDIYNFPRVAQPESFFLSQYLKGAYGKPADVSPYISSLFSTLERYQVSHEIAKSLKNGKIVIANSYIGANLSHNGAKFTTAQERRGFFIWLDNLEFYMMGMPRPDISFVLRSEVDAEVKLSDQKPQYQNQEVFDDLCQLFPKDFIRVDCNRDKKLMSQNLIANIVWQKVEQKLPNLGRPELGATSTQDDDIQSRSIPKNLTSDDVGQGVSEMSVSASLIMTQELRKFGHKLRSKVADKTLSSVFYIPDVLDQTSKKAYSQTIKEILRLNQLIYQKLEVFLRSNNNNTQNLHLFTGALMPLASTHSYQVSDTSPNEFINSILNSDLQTPEILDISKQIGLKGTQKQHKSQSITGNEVNNIAQSLLDSSNKSGQYLTLISWLPRNELDVLTQIIFQHSSATIEEITRKVSQWPIDQKALTLTKYLTNTLKTKGVNLIALNTMLYKFELQTDFLTMQTLLSNLTPVEITWQKLTPRFGYETPEIFEKSNLESEHQTCYDLSLQLYSALQASGYPDIAHYALLQGHRHRWTVSLNLSHILILINLQKQNVLNTFTDHVIDSISENHPLASEVLRSI